jgi:hypothetical protein
MKELEYWLVYLDEDDIGGFSTVRFDSKECLADASGALFVFSAPAKARGYLTAMEIVGGQETSLVNEEFWRKAESLGGKIIIDPVASKETAPCSLT